MYDILFEGIKGEEAQVIVDIVEDNLKNLINNKELDDDQIHEAIEEFNKLCLILRIKSCFEPDEDDPPYL